MGEIWFLTCSECESLGLDDFPTAKRLQWHGIAPETPDWSKTSRFVAFSLVPLSLNSVWRFMVSVFTWVIQTSFLFLFLIFCQVDSVKKEIYVGFNTSHLATLVTLPNRPGYRWEPFVDTSKPSPFDCITHDLPGRETAMKQYRHFLDANMYPMLSYSSIILLLSPIDDSWVCVIPQKV